MAEGFVSLSVVSTVFMIIDLLPAAFEPPRHSRSRRY
jgi:hypothetical protein